MSLEVLLMLFGFCSWSYALRMPEKIQKGEESFQDEITTFTTGALNISLLNEQQTISSKKQPINGWDAHWWDVFYYTMKPWKKESNSGRRRRKEMEPTPAPTTPAPTLAPTTPAPTPAPTTPAPTTETDQQHCLNSCCRSEGTEMGYNATISKVLNGTTINDTGEWIYYWLRVGEIPLRCDSTFRGPGAFACNGTCFFCVVDCGYTPAPTPSPPPPLELCTGDCCRKKNDDMDYSNDHYYWYRGYIDGGCGATGTWPVGQSAPGDFDCDSSCALCVQNCSLVFPSVE